MIRRYIGSPSWHIRPQLFSKQGIMRMNNMTIKVTKKSKTYRNTDNLSPKTSSY